MNEEDLLNIINDDDLGLLAIKPKKDKAATADERLVSSFLEINNFIQEYDREPKTGGDIREHSLAARLDAFRSDKNKAALLLDFDEYGLLEVQNKEIKTLRDIWEDDDIGILKNTDDSLYQLTNVPAFKDRAEADFIAHRKNCKDFDLYENLFIECQKDLASGQRKLIKFTSDQQIQEHSFFVLNGILLYVDTIGDTHIDKYGKRDGRQRCIFENGTESNMLFRSLVKRLYENGYAVTEKSDDTKDLFFKNFGAINEEDTKTGFIYVLKTLSENPKIKNLENLYKIGFSTIPIEDRIKNAKDDPTFLMAPVKIVETFECYNLNPQKLELLLHNFFGSACLNIDIYDTNGKRVTPREWFIAPLPVIDEAINLIISGGIVNYKYDINKQIIVLK